MGDGSLDVGHVRVHFETTNLAGQDAFIEGYVLDAVERLPETDVCEEFAFVRVEDGEGVPDMDDDSDD